MTGRGKKAFGVPLLAVALVALTGTTGFAEKITIGTLRWEVLPGAELLECVFTEPCHYFLIENKLKDLSSNQLSALSLQGDEAFASANLADLPDPVGIWLGDIAADPLFNYGQAYSFDAVTMVSLLFSLPDTMTGTLLSTTIHMADLTDGVGSANIQVESDDVPVPVPEPGTLGLVAVGLGAAWARRRRSAP